MTDLMATRKCQILLSVPIALYFFCVIAYLSPKSEWSNRITTAISPVWNYFRFDQNWALFSPVIRDINYHAAAVITFQDGTKTIWDLPRMNHLYQHTQYSDERWRKWSSDCAPWPNYKEFWPDLARWIGRKFYNPNNKPVAVVIELFWVNIPASTVNQPQEALPYHSKNSRIFSYRFSDSDFK